MPEAETILRNLTPSSPPPRLQLRLGFNLHNLPHLEGLGGGENRRVQRTEEGFSKHQRKLEGEKLGQEESRLQTTDNILPSTAGVNLVHLPRDKKEKKKKKWAVTSRS